MHHYKLVAIIERESINEMKRKTLNQVEIIRLFATILSLAFTLYLLQTIYF